MGGRGSSSNMRSGGSSGADMSAGVGGSFMSNRENMEDYAIATGALDVGSEEETRAYLRTAEGREALTEFMEGEIEAGLTEREMRETIDSVVGTAYKVSDVPSRIKSYTFTGSGMSGDYESKTYVTRNGNAIKEVTKWKDGGKSTTTVMQNYPQYPEYHRTRAQFESTLANMAKSNIRAGIKVTAIDNKKKKR